MPRMPITSSAKKALRSSKRKRVFNLRRLEELKSSAKELKKIATSDDSTAIQTALSRAYKAIDKATKRGVIKKNTGSRRKSLLARLV